MKRAALRVRQDDVVPGAPGARCRCASVSRRGRVRARQALPERARRRLRRRVASTTSAAIWLIVGRGRGRTGPRPARRFRDPAPSAGQPGVALLLARRLGDVEAPPRPDRGSDRLALVEEHDRPVRQEVRTPRGLPSGWQIHSRGHRRTAPAAARQHLALPEPRQRLEIAAWVGSRSVQPAQRTASRLATRLRDEHLARRGPRPSSCTGRAAASKAGAQRPAARSAKRRCDAGRFGSTGRSGWRVTNGREPVVEVCQSLHVVDDALVRAQRASGQRLGAALIDLDEPPVASGRSGDSTSQAGSSNSASANAKVGYARGARRGHARRAHRPGIRAPSPRKAAARRARTASTPAAAQARPATELWVGVRARGLHRSERRRDDRRSGRADGGGAERRA